MTTELNTNNAEQMGNDVVYASYNGVAVWRSPERPLVKIATANRTDALTVVARLEGAWLQVAMPDGTHGFVQGAAVTAAAYTPPPAPMARPPAIASAPVAAPAADPARITDPAPTVVLDASPPARASSPAPAPVAASASTAGAVSPPPVQASACASCGRALTDDAAFCAGCGTPRPAPVMAACETACTSCGRTNDADAAFCAGCGRAQTTDNKQPAGAQLSADSRPQAAGSRSLVAADATGARAWTGAPPPPPASPAVAAQPYAPGAGAPQFRMPSSVAHPEFFAFVLCNLLLVVSALMPWENFGIATASGLDVNRGWFVLIAALIAGGMAAWGAFQPNGLPFLRWVQLGSAFVGYAMPIIELSLIGDAKDCNNSNSLFSDCAFAPDAGIGVIVALLAANALAGIALIRNHTPRSYVLCSLLGPLGAGIEWLIRQNERRAASA